MRLAIRMKRALTISILLGLLTLGVSVVAQELPLVKPKASGYPQSVWTHCHGRTARYR